MENLELFELVPDSLHSKMSLFPSSSCRSWGFLTKEGANVSPVEPILRVGDDTPGLELLSLLEATRQLPGRWGQLQQLVVQLCSSETIFSFGNYETIQDLVLKTLCLWCVMEPRGNILDFLFPPSCHLNLDQKYYVFYFIFKFLKISFNIWRIGDNIILDSIL